MRRAIMHDASPLLPCCRCKDAIRHWDRIAGNPYCHECLEALAKGEAEFFKERVEPRRCAICLHRGTVCFLTFPLHSRKPVEMDMCSTHLRDLVNRSLEPRAFERLRHQLKRFGLKPLAVFLLHDAFYDEQGRALQPAIA